MSIFGKIASAIFGIHTANAAEAQPGEATMPSNMPAAATAAPTATSAPAAATAASGSAAPVAAGAVQLDGVDVTKILDGLKAKQSEALDWRRSIVDLMKLLNLDSSLSVRKELAKELGYTGDMGDSATMNVWLHKQVITKLAQNGGIVPAELKH